MTEDPTQMQRYARDFAEVYTRYEKLRRGLLLASDQALEVAQALTEEELLSRLSRSLRASLSAPVDVYVLRRNKLVRIEEAATGLPSTLTKDASELPEQGYTIQWLRGRRKPVGAILVQADRLGADGDLARLIGPYAGVALENLRLEGRRRGVSTPAQRSRRFVGESPAVARLLQDVRRVSATATTVLLEGETGTGKSLLAREIHALSPRAKKPFVLVNCAAIPSQLVESELFGHEAGAFTGALGRRKGLVEQAEGGTLFMDEVGELPSDVQAKLLLFLEERTFRRVGGEGRIPADVRLLSATNMNLDKAIEEGRFRADLLYRLRVFSFRLPPLRERGEDIVQMASSMLVAVAKQYGLPSDAEISAPVRRRLLDYPWPGNARELRNALERALILSGGGALDPDLLPGSRSPGKAEQLAGRSAQGQAAPTTLQERSGPLSDPSAKLRPFKEAKEAVVEEFERGYLEALLQQEQGNVSAAARVANLDKRHIHRKIKSYGMDADEYRKGS